jgi:ribosomal protein S18 acetylase RimI-like enzyme
MAVAPAHRRQGIARALLRTAEAFCRAAGYTRIVLSTSELQQPAMRLYASSGYRLVRTEVATEPTHKTPGAGLTRYHYEKRLAAVGDAAR